MFSLNLKTAQTFFKLNNKTIKIKNFYNLVKSKTMFTKPKFFSTNNKDYFQTECVEGTNRVCTPFTYEGVEYTDCYSGYLHYQCIEPGKTGWEYCGKCTGPPEVSTTTGLFYVKLFGLSYVNFFKPKIIFIILSISMKVQV